mgnify:CR=1 FL=1
MGNTQLSPYKIKFCFILSYLSIYFLAFIMVYCSQRRDNTYDVMFGLRGHFGLLKEINIFLYYL